jgi:two-component system chemotaxis response regulator CheY
MIQSRFIVIDDDPTSNLICRMVIQKYLHPIDIEIFTSPAAGLAYIQKEYGSNPQQNPAILFLDIHMPVISGWEFLQQLEKLPFINKEMFRVYILSSTIEVRDIIQNKKSGLVTDYLLKPLTKEKVMDVFGT